MLLHELISYMYNFKYLYSQMLKIEVPCDPKPLGQVKAMLYRKRIYEEEASEKRRKHEEEMLADLLNYEEDVQTFIDGVE